MRRQVTCVVALVALAASAAAVARPPLLRREIEDALRGAKLAAGDASVTVISPSGEVIVGIFSGQPMKPASNMKILTTLAALELLGADYRYETRIRALGTVDNGVVRGDVAIIGGGDPNISGRFYEGDPLRLLRTWARELEARGIRRIQGDLIADDRFFDDERFLDSWKPIHEGRSFAAEVSPLSLNDNCLDVRIIPRHPGMPARVEVSPRCPLVKVHGAPLTVAAGSPKILIHRALDGNSLEISGRIAADSAEWRDQVAVHDPALFFAHTFAAALEEEGIALGGSVRRVAEHPGEEEAENPGGAARRGEKDGAAADSGPGPVRVPGRLTHPAPAAEEGILLVAHSSPLALDLPVINKESQNLHAEMLLKTIGKRVEGDGSVRAGARAIHRFLAEKGIGAEGLVVADGSGLSHENRVTTGMLARALFAARNEPYFEAFYDSLGVAGEDGTLSDRFRSDPGLTGRVHAKTGYISGVSALSGYLETGKPSSSAASVWTFSLLFRRLPGGNRSIKRLQEAIVALVDRHATGGDQELGAAR